MKEFNNIIDNDISQSVLGKTYDDIGNGFNKIMATVEKLNESEGGITVVDTLKIQHEVFEWSMRQEVVTKIASKSVASINDVLKAQ